MAVSNRRTVLTDLKTDLEAITVANGFQTTVAKVLRGIHTEEEFAGNMPGICFWNEAGPRKNFAQGRSERKLVIHIWGYVNVQADVGDYDALDKLAADVEKMLMTPARNAYWQFTEIGDTVYYEGGIDDPIGIFEMIVEIAYNYTFASP